MICNEGGGLLSHAVNDCDRGIELDLQLRWGWLRVIESSAVYSYLPHVGFVEHAGGCEVLGFEFIVSHVSKRVKSWDKIIIKVIKSIGRKLKIPNVP